MTRISPERKSATLAKLLPPYNMTVAAVAQIVSCNNRCCMPMKHP
ncbi:hypothetical protein [Xenorhabdus lircayensis]|nr:hypothetical protein [Xenorhabdus lircayensis]